MTVQTRSALVLFSGGQDSATCLAWALDRFDHVETVGFDYGQRHHVELEIRPQARIAIAAAKPEWSARLGADHPLDARSLGSIGNTAMTEDIEIKMGESGLPNTFLPGRNLLFYVLASAVAYRRGLDHIVSGVCETDFSGYPDCRDETIKALGHAINLGTAHEFAFDTPLMWISKAETWTLAEALGGKALVDVIIEETHTCYMGDRQHRHGWGYGCGTCPACELRAKGYQDYRGGAEG